MSAELIGILAVGATLGSLVFVLFGWLRADIKSLDAKQDARLNAMASRLDAVVDSLAALRERVAHLEGGRAPLASPAGKPAAGD